MAKGQMRGNRELKKPKKPKPPPVAVVSSFLDKASSGSLKPKK
jgi:hypothetical protein